ncbi:MAG: hypothetical protein Homavirus15_10, partial [Homavirus sp.]
MFQQLTALDIYNTKYKKIHADIKPENILLVGVSNKVKKIIDAFNKCNFDALYKKNVDKIDK